MADLNPTFGDEQTGRRPVLVASVDPFNGGLSGLVVVPPITSRLRNIPLHIEVRPPEGGLSTPSAILCDAVRSIDRRRLVARWGTVAPATMDTIEGRLRTLLGL